MHGQRAETVDERGRGESNNERLSRYLQYSQQQKAVAVLYGLNEIDEKGYRPVSRLTTAFTTNQLCPRILPL